MICKCESIRTEPEQKKTKRKKKLRKKNGTKDIEWKYFNEIGL